MISNKLIQLVRLSPKRAYKIAHEAGIHPSTMSKLLNGIEQIKPKDPRVIAVGRVLGIPPEECFAEAEKEQDKQCETAGLK